MKILLTALGVSIAAFSAAQTAMGPLPFHAVPGVQEFSGRMVARPQPQSILVRQGMNAGLAAQTRTAARADLAPLQVRYYKETDEIVFNVPAGKTENQVAIELMATGRYQYVEPDWTVYPVAIPNDASYGSQWHLPKISAPLAWDLFTSATTNNIIAITDTGVHVTHEDLAAKMVSGANSSTGTAVPQTSGGVVTDQHGHGTHCAGIAAASGNNGLGVSGAGWGTRIMPIRVTAAGSGGSASLTALTNGARWAADNGAKVVSTSFSGVTSSSVQTTGAYLRSKNVLYFWAAGNSNVNMTTGDHADVNIIGASDSNDAKASFSNYGVAIDLFAPGVNIFATLRTSNSAYGNMSGTSMACPLAAGTAALLAASNPRITTQQVEQAMYSTAQDLGAAGNDSTFGWGRINMNAALRQLYQTVPFEATSIAVVGGGTVTGSAANLWSSDNAYWQGTFDQNGVYDITFTPTNMAPGSLVFRFEDGVSQDASRSLFYMNGATEVLISGTSVANGPDGTMTVNVPTAAYIGGQVKIRVKVSVLTRTGARSITSRVDQATLTAAP